METGWTPAKANGSGIAAQDGYVAATNVNEDASQNGDDTRETETPESPGKPRRKRGRIAKDPLNQTFLYHCRSAEDLETMLRDHLKDATSPPEHTTVEFLFPITSAFMVYPFGHSQAIKDPLKRIFSKSAVSVAEALQPTLNPKDQIEKQRAIAKVCVEAVGKADGYKYGFNNNWISKEDQASRFSYFCNDSSLNRARAGNPAASNRVAHKKAQKPVYYCEGTIAVKFSVTKQLLEVHYKHIPCHETYAARAPVPRKGTRRRILMEMFEPDALPKPKDPVAAKAVKEGKISKQQKKTEASRASLDGQGTDASSSAPPEGSGDGPQDTLEPILRLVNTIEAETQVSREPSVFPAEKLKDLQNASAKAKPGSKKRPAKPSPPGVMSDFMDGDKIRLGEERPTKKQMLAEAKAVKKSQEGAVHVQGVGIFVPTDPNVPAAQPSELDILKAKLAQAEQRIRRLEAEKGSPVPPTQNQPPYYFPPQAFHQSQPLHYQYPHAHPAHNQWQPHPNYGPPHGMLHPPGGTQQRPPAPPYGFDVLKENRSGPLTEAPAPLLSSIAEATADELIPSSAETATALAEAANARDKAIGSTNATSTTAGDTEAKAPATSEEASTEVAPSADEEVSRPASDTPTTDAALSGDPPTGDGENRHSRRI